MTSEFSIGIDRKEIAHKARLLFENVRSVPYVLGLDGNPDKLFEEYKGNCTRKHLFLASKLLPLGYKVSLGVAVFDWRELPIPKGITALLKDSKDTHLFLYVSLGERETVVDATWDQQMPDGFIKNTWDGENSTQIGVPVKGLRRQDLKVFQAKVLVGYPLRIIRDSFDSRRPTPFNDAFNQWLGRNK